MLGEKMTWDDQMVKIKYKLKKRSANQPTLQFMRSAPLPIAVILLSPKLGVKQASHLTKLKLDTTTPFLPIDGEKESIIRDNAIDAIVFGKSSTVDSCKIYSRLLPRLPTKHVLRNFGYQLQRDDNRFTDLH